VAGTGLQWRRRGWPSPSNDGAPGPPHPRPRGTRAQPPPFSPAAAGMQVTWLDTPLRVVGGRVVSTAPDGMSVECVDARDGTLLWKVGAAQEDVYLADVYGGKVVIV